MTFADKLRNITKAYNGICDILDDKDLAKAGLTLSDYRECQRLMPLLGEPGRIAYTLYKKAADYFKNKGFIVSESGSGYQITI